MKYKSIITTIKLLTLSFCTLSIISIQAHATNCCPVDVECPCFKCERIYGMASTFRTYEYDTDPTEAEIELSDPYQGNDREIEYETEWDLSTGTGKCTVEMEVCNPGRGCMQTTNIMVDELTWCQYQKCLDELDCADDRID